MLSASEITIRELEARIRRLESVLQIHGPYSAPPMQVTLKCPGMMTIETQLLTLPGGSAPVARYGALTAGSAPGLPDTIATGCNPKVLA